MPWAKLDDQFPDHPKVDPLSDVAFRLHVAALCHSARYLTDGFVSEHRVPRLVPRYRSSAVAELVASGLWEVEDGGWRIHDYTTYNPSAEEVEERREHERQKKARQRNGAARHANGRFVSPRDNPGDSPRDVPGEYLGDDPGESPQESPRESLRTRTRTRPNTLLSSRDNITSGAESGREDDDASLKAEAEAQAQAALEAKLGRGEQVANRKAYLAKVTAERLDELRAKRPDPEAMRRSAASLGANWASALDDPEEAQATFAAKLGDQELRDVALAAWREARSASA